jgi:chromosome segregation ATPase
MITLRWSMVILLLTGACGTSAPSLSRVERERLPRDARQEIFDAENDVIIARNRQDEAEERIRALRAALDQLDERQGRSEKRLSSSAGGSSRVSALRKVTRAEQDYLEARLDVAESDSDVAEQEVVTARARLDLVKQRQLVRIGKVPLASLKDFEKTIETQEAKGKQRRASSLDLRSKAQARLDAWKAAQEGYASQTGDFDSGVWIE